MTPSRARTAPAEADSSFELLYRGHRADVFRAALRELGNVQDAEDVTQAAFVDAYRALRRGTRPESPRAWLLAIAANVTRRRFRSAGRRPREEPLETDAPAPEQPREQAEALLAAVAELPQGQREAFLLREVAGLAYEEIAERTGSTVGSVQMLLFRARRTLRGRLSPPTALPSGFLPLPGWLAGLRPESLALAPRAAGVAGAAALVLGGGGAAVERGEATPLPRDVEPRVTAVPAPAQPAWSRSVVPAAAPAPASAKPARAAAAPPRRAAPPPRTKAPAPVSADAPAAALPADPVPEPPAPPPPTAPDAAPRPAPGVPAPPASTGTLGPAVDAVAEPVVEIVTPVVEPVVEPVAEAAQPVVEPLADLVGDAGEGAAGAADAVASPLPLPPLAGQPPMP